jgi:preprotein translocase subunit SecD
VSKVVQQFIAGAFGLIAVFLILAHYTGAGRVIGALGSNSALVFKTLQGR